MRPPAIGGRPHPVQAGAEAAGLGASPPTSLKKAGHEQLNGALLIRRSSESGISSHPPGPKKTQEAARDRLPVGSQKTAGLAVK